MKKRIAENASRYYKKKKSQYTDSEKEERRQKWRDQRKKKKQAQLENSQVSNANKYLKKSNSYRK